MARPRFGTDGLRGVANVDITAELALAVGRAAARALPGSTFVVGRDTRRSGSLLQAALAAGMASEGADVDDVGVLPTPGVARIAERRGLPAAVVSASHNPFEDNGVKLLAPGGTKLPVEVEQAVEAELDRVLAGGAERAAGGGVNAGAAAGAGVVAGGGAVVAGGGAGAGAVVAGGAERPRGTGVGRVRVDARAADEYCTALVDTLDGRRLDGLAVALDCAHGAASAIAPRVFSALGATVEVHAAAPDGANINAGCGSTHPEALQELVIASGAALGLAFDGDADRVLAVDHTGTLVDGDRLLALFALDLQARDALNGDAVVVTVMTNLWFRRYMAEHAIAVHETPVGDRHVLAALDEDGLALGGEQSGHIVFRRLATTGDGVLAGLVLADLLARQGRSLAELASALPASVPQVLRNVAVRDPAGVTASGTLRAAVAEAEATLAERGRVLVRASGTEPVIRIMVEAMDPAEASAVADQLAAVAQRPPLT